MHDSPKDNLWDQVEKGIIGVDIKLPVSLEAQPRSCNLQHTSPKTPKVDLVAFTARLTARIPSCETGGLETPYIE